MNLQYAPVPSHIPTHSGALCPPATSAPIDITEGRRNSNGSVKELVHSFKEMEQSREIEERALQVRRQKSAGRLAAGGTTKPTWK